MWRNAPPIVTTQSCPPASASAIRNSSFRALLPDISIPEQSSLLIHHSTPSSDSTGHAHGTTGVGNAAKGTRPAVGAFRPAAHEGGTYATRFMW